VKYISLDEMSESVIVILEPTEEGTLVINTLVMDKGMRLEARIKYRDRVLSPWISSREPVSVQSSHKYFCPQNAPDPTK
jgi:hypothetical protein